MTDEVRACNLMHKIGKLFEKTQDEVFPDLTGKLHRELFSALIYAEARGVLRAVRYNNEKTWSKDAKISRELRSMAAKLQKKARTCAREGSFV